MDHYERLRVSRDAPLEVIRAAYRALAAKHHPDRHGQSEGAHFDMALLNGAYEVLSDPMQRAQYDAQLRMNDATQASATTQAGAARGAAADSAMDQDIADALSDIDWESLKSPPPVNPWLSKKRLVPIAAAVSLVVVGLVGWWLNDLTHDMEAERAISAHLGQMAVQGSAGARPASASATDPLPTDAAVAESASKPVDAAADSLPAAARMTPEEKALAAATPALSGAKAHMLDGSPLNLKLDVRTHPMLTPAGSAAP